MNQRTGAPNQGGQRKQEIRLGIEVLAIAHRLLDLIHHFPDAGTRGGGTGPIKNKDRLSTIPRPPLTTWSMRCDKVTNFFRFNKLFAKIVQKSTAATSGPEIAAVFLSYPDRPGICLPEAQPKNLLGI